MQEERLHRSQERDDRLLRQEERGQDQQQMMNLFAQAAAAFANAMNNRN